jgi:hypothetical protein
VFALTLKLVRGRARCRSCAQEVVIELEALDEKVARHSVGHPLPVSFGRSGRFVPKRSFAKGWALIIRSCLRCNNEKSDLEDDIAAITLQQLVQ